ncbi:hypothetical protein BKA66DRAFT_444807 [Pyrenochaeta sp. MPI-SDFR-AT-0127]|nr:hypothetical protein BKA66DRAFT_444807 [Pyrenochaeta sp. MPI-SDFR-AT-0127]
MDSSELRALSKDNIYCAHELASQNMICRYWAPKNRVIIKEVSKKDKRRFESDLPSWIKCLEHSTYGTPDKVFVGQEEADSLVGPPSRSWYKACGLRKPQVTFGKKTPSDKPVVLHEDFDGTVNVVGIKLGEIREVSPRMIPGILPQEAVALGGWLHSGVNKKLHVDDVPERLWRTLIANKTKDGMQPLPNFPTYCLKMLQQEDTRGDIHLDKIMTTIDADDGMSHFLRRVRDVCFNRKLFIGGATKELTGLCPKGSRVGDIICILYGCSVPVVLRRCNKRPTFGLDPACDNDLTEKATPQISRKSTTMEQLIRHGTHEEPDKTYGAEDPLKQYREENPWLGRPLISAPVGPDSSSGPHRAVVNLPPTPLQPPKSDGPSGIGDFRRASTFAAGQDGSPIGKAVTLNGSTSKSPGHHSAQDDQKNRSEVYYEVVGECFVCDKMDGEACPGSSRLLWEETFTLI